MSEIAPNEIRICSKHRWCDSSCPFWMNDPARPVIFLDIDGVLLTRESLRVSNSTCDQRCIVLLNGLVKETDAEIVVSSSWRIIRPLDYIRGALCAAGFQYPGHIIGVTDHIVWETEGSLVVGAATRATEIRDWLRSHPRERFVIFDDGTDAEIAGHYVRTPSDTGLAADHAARAVAILGSPAVSWGWAETRGVLAIPYFTPSAAPPPPPVHGPFDHTPRCNTGGCKP